MLIMAATLTRIIPLIPEANDILHKPKLAKKIWPKFQEKFKYV